MHESENESEVTQSCLTLHDPMGYSLPGSSVYGIFQARVLEWGALPSPLLSRVSEKNKSYVTYPFLLSVLTVMNPLMHSLNYFLMTS